MKLQEHIALIRTITTKLNSNINVSDEAIAKMLVMARNTVYSQAKVKLSKQSYNNIILNLSLDPLMNCESLSCKILKSIETLPKILNKDGEPLMTVYTLGGNIITHRCWEQRKFDSYHPIVSQSKIKTYDILDGKLVIQGNTDLKKVAVEAVFEDPFSIIEYSCGTSPCYDPLSSVFPMDTGLANLIYEQVYRLLGIPNERIEQQKIK